MRIMGARQKQTPRPASTPGFARARTRRHAYAGRCPGVEPVNDDETASKRILPFSATRRVDGAARLPPGHVPDLAGWRRERLPEMPDDALFVLAPDGVCEVLSPPTADYDRDVKLPVYARSGVPHAWLVDPTLRRLEVLRLGASGHRMVETCHGDEAVRAEPFDAIELPLGVLWAR
jgi:Uma2 family endonuclease